MKIYFIVASIFFSFGQAGFADEAKSNDKSLVTDVIDPYDLEAGCREVNGFPVLYVKRKSETKDLFTSNAFKGQFARQKCDQKAFDIQEKVIEPAKLKGTNVYLQHPKSPDSPPVAHGGDPAKELKILEQAYKCDFSTNNDFLNGHVDCDPEVKIKTVKCDVTLPNGIHGEIETLVSCKDGRSANECMKSTQKDIQSTGTGGAAQ